MSWLKRKLSILYSRRAYNPERRKQQQQQVDKRVAESGAHQLHYYHQVDDPYSHLSAQVLLPLLSRYDIELIPYLVGPPDDDYAPEEERLQIWSRTDASLLAPAYALQYTNSGAQPKPDLCALAQTILAKLIQNPRDFAEQVGVISHALWGNDAEALEAQARQIGTATVNTEASIQAGKASRGKLGHYLGATFYYGETWYWGVDRLHYLEQRLIDMGIERQPQGSLIAPVPTHRAEPGAGSGLQLEFFASLRSPYTSIVFDRLNEFCTRTGVELITLPVLPMVMRRLPVPPRKGQYIMRDTLREAERLGVAFGNICDPVGEPVERTYSLFPWAEAQGKGYELLYHASRAAWSEAIDLGTDHGLAQVVKRAGLNWDDAPKPLQDSSWKQMCESNQQKLLDHNLWGVPSFRLSGENFSEMTVWGQDRLWALEQALQQRHESAPARDDNN